ncbi:hypothetical protein C2S51_030587 [Perilla frutescens var. frutescens]|nr:hypothetical protein C2S51_030587 [Perilla frutescens var. frutescens]
MIGNSRMLIVLVSMRRREKSDTTGDVAVQEVTEKLHKVRMADPKELFAMFNDMYEKSVGTPSSTVTSNHTMTEHVGAEMDEPTRSHAPDLSIVKQDDKMSDSMMSPTTSLFESEAIKCYPFDRC